LHKQFIPGELSGSQHENVHTVKRRSGPRKIKSVSGYKYGRFKREKGHERIDPKGLGNWEKTILKVKKKGNGNHQRGSA